MDLSQFESKLGELCKISQYSIALPESSDLRVLQAADYLLKSKSVRELVLFLDPAAYAPLATKAGIDPSPQRVGLVFASQRDPGIVEKTEDHINKVFTLKQKKKSAAQLRVLAQSALYQAGYLCAARQVDACLAGAVHTTADVIRAGLATVGLSPGVATVSGSFFMVNAAAPKSRQLMLYADCAVVIEPTAAQLADIAAASVASWQAVVGSDTPPRLAFLSFSTRGSAAHPLVDKVAAALALFRERHPSIACDGELQFDAAIDPEVSARKAPDSPLAGDANIMIFPSLEAGNIAYKVSQRLGQYSAYGPILQGLARPFSDLSRGAQTKDIVVASWINLLRAAKLRA